MKIQSARRRFKQLKKGLNVVQKCEDPEDGGEGPHQRDQGPSGREERCEGAHQDPQEVEEEQEDQQERQVERTCAVLKKSFYHFFGDHLVTKSGFCSDEKSKWS